MFKEKKEGKIIDFPHTVESMRKALPQLNKEIAELEEELRWMREALQAPEVEISKKDRKRGKEEPKNLTEEERENIKDLITELGPKLGQLLLKREDYERETLPYKEVEELEEARRKVS